MINFLYNALRAIYSLAVKLLMIFIREQKDINVVGTHNGKQFTGNSKYFFRYLYSVNPKSSYIITKRLSTVKEIRESYPSSNVLFAYSLRSIFILARAKNLYLIAGETDFGLCHLITLKSKRVINLFHGTALKAIGSDESTTLFRECLDAYIVSSEMEQRSISETFKLSIDKVWITGLPKNDILVDKRSDLSGREKIILYAPTFRDDGAKIKLFPFVDMNFVELEALLERHNAVIELRLHINSVESIRNSNYITSDRIRFSNPYIESDSQLLLEKSSMLITDYSSIYLDFLLMDRPMLFIPYDYEEYNRVRGFLFPYFESTPGPKVTTGAEFLDYLDRGLSDESIDSELRSTCLDKFHRYREGFSERVFNRVNTLN